jgi:uncharacterized protein (DUF2062 family)
MRNFFQTRIVAPLARLLSQGMPAKRIALSMAVGLAISVIPVLGIATGLCLAAAFLFRLNVAAMQLVNWLATPIQLALLFPFYQFGARLAGLTPLSVSPSALRESLSADPLGLIQSFWQQVLAGTALWLVVALPAVWVFAKVFLALIHRIEPARVLQSVPGQRSFAGSVGGTL